MQLDINCLTVKVQESTAKDIYDFRSCLFRVYDNQFMHGVLDEEEEKWKNCYRGSWIVTGMIMIESNACSRIG